MTKKENSRKCVIIVLNTTFVLSFKWEKPTIYKEQMV